jgi:predicted helicase
MPDHKIESLKSVDNFESLVSYLRDELDWPIEVENADDITFDYDPEDLNIEEKYAAKINNIKQIRPLTDNQPWGIFFIEFEPKKLPVVVMRRILRALIHKKRSYDDKKPTWKLHDLMFISSLGEVDERKISFAHFTESDEGLPELKTFSWDKSDTYFHYLQNKLDLEKLRWPDNDENILEWRTKWSSAFKLRHREVIKTSQQLALEMAHLAGQIRDRIKEVYEYEVLDGPLHNLYNNFKQVLIHDLEVHSFADMYAQTVSYGLFSARVAHEGDFIVEDINAMIPNTNPFLKKLFNECTDIGKTSDDNLDMDELGITELIKTLKESNIEAVIADFGRQKHNEDPVVHFYELFLSEYDPEQKVKRGVFYTPDPVVSFIVRSVDALLKEEFKCSEGLADISKITIKKIRPKKKGNGYVAEDKPVHKVQILDPAVGTGTFLKHTIEIIKQEFNKNHNLEEKELKKKWNDYVIADLLPRLFGFELMMAPYAVCHLKLGLELAETGYNFEKQKRLGVYLTNTLEGTHKGAGTLDAYLNWLAKEGHKANIIKANSPINVIIGNPPYAGHSANVNEWIRSLVEDYRYIENVRLNLAQGKWLQNDYVKFIRFGEWKINKTGYGILAFITDHSYLDGDTFPGMRYHLMKTFDKIMIINLHGNTRKREKCPDGSIDENVFDIEQGTSIIICVKNNQKDSSKNELSKILYFDCWGNRPDKYEFLNKNQLSTINFKKLNPKKPNYFFIPRKDEFSDEFYDFPSIVEILSPNMDPAPGFLTTHDDFAISFSIEELKEKINVLLSTDNEEEARENFRLCRQNQWNYKKAKGELKNYQWDKEIIKCLYRPFDYRYTVYNPNILVHRRERISNHLRKEDNIAIATTRMTKGESFQHAFATNKITEVILLSSKTSNNAFIFPLYKINPLNTKNKTTFLNTEIIKNISSNLSLKFLENGHGDIIDTIGPEDIMSYIYAILYSRGYQNRYKSELEKEFPHIPLSKNRSLFTSLTKKGNELIDLHLMNKSPSNRLDINFVGEGDNTVEKIPSPNKDLEKIGYNNYELPINQTQKFIGIPDNVWNFKIGGYKVIHKWLNYRKNRKLSQEDLNHVKKIILILNRTIEIMDEIEEIIDSYGGWPIK